VAAKNVSLTFFRNFTQGTKVIRLFLFFINFYPLNFTFLSLKVKTLDKINFEPTNTSYDDVST
jgi:hypothetical protein